jgi:hypothetical protein
MVTPDSLRAARGSYAIALHGVIRDHSTDKSQVFILVEGKDSDYYRSRVAAVFATSDLKISYRNIKGKKNEKLLIKAIKGNASLSNIRYLAFFDRDYENDLAEITQPENYITPGYSIENLYTEGASVKEMVHGLLFADAVHADNDTDVVNSLVDEYEALQGEFHKSVELFNKWAWVQRHMPRDGALDLDKFEVHKHCVLDFAQKKISPCYSLDDLNALASERAPVTNGEITLASAWFDSRTPRNAFRGKQEAAFLYYFLQNAIVKAGAGEFPFSKNVKCTKRVSQKELISELSNYADTPKNLIEFLEDRKRMLVA